jgi:hypothetical protein
MTSTARASPKAVSGNQKLHHAMGHDPSLKLSDSRYQAMDLSDEGDVTYRDISELSFMQLCPKIADMSPLSEKAMQQMI